MRTTTILQLIFGCLLHVTWISASDSCTEIKGLPTNFGQINGLWNLKAVGSRVVQHALNKVHYAYAKLSLNENEGTVTETFNPLEGMNQGPVLLKRVPNEKGTLSYKKVDEEGSASFTIFQVHPDVLIMTDQSNELIEISALCVRSTARPELELEQFKEMIKCKDFTFYKEFNISVNYAHKCFGLIQENKFLEETKDNFTSWHLVAKSSSSMEPRYNVRILYTARLEITRKEGEFTLKEIITAPTDNVISEVKFGKSIEGGALTFLTFNTEEGLLLLGIQTESGSAVYLASRTPTVRQSVIQKFKAQTLCFETKYNYFMPGSIREDATEAEACASNLQKWEPINFRESVGKWILIASAHESAETILSEVSSTYGASEITVVNDKVHLSHTEITTSTVNTMEEILVDESAGHIIYTETPSGIRTAVHSVNPNCIVFSDVIQRLFLNCHVNQFPSIDDISQFVKYATCQNFNKILIRQPASYLCSDIPTEVHVLDVEKLAGTWKLVAVASSIPENESDLNFPIETQFIVNNGEVTMTIGNWTRLTKKIENRRLQYDTGNNSTLEIRFYEPLGDSMLTWMGNAIEQKRFLVLYTRSGHASPDEIITLKHFAACLSLRVVFLVE